MDTRKNKRKSNIFWHSLLLFLLSFFLTGCQSSTPEIPTEIQLSRQEVPVSLKIDNITPNQFNNFLKYLQDFNYLNDYLLDNVHQVIFTNDLSPYLFNQSEHLIGGFMDVNTRDIYIDISQYDSLVLAHECMHVFDYYGDDNRSDTSYSLTEEWKNLYQEESQNLIDTTCIPINNATPSEGFVTCMINYRYMTGTMKEVAPNMYQYFNRIVEENRGEKLEE